MFEWNKAVNDAPLSSLMDSIISPKVKTTKGEGVGAGSLVRGTSKVEGVLELRIRKTDKQFNYSHEPVQTKQ